MNHTSEIIQALDAFKIKVSLVSRTVGPRIVRYEFKMQAGVTVAKVRRMSDNLTLALSADQVRVEAPVKGKGTIAVEVPRTEVDLVSIGSVLNSIETKAHPLTVVLGKDTAGKPACMNLAEAPHTLIAGATGSGKSVCLNAILLSLITRCDPFMMQLVLIDPKRVELRPYHEVPHLAVPVACGADEAMLSLAWVTEEMDRRYARMELAKVRSIDEYNQAQKAIRRMPYLVVVIDEVADLMMISEGEVETVICRIAQLGRASGIHLVVATQRPDRTVLTGTIKANIPCRIAFTTSSAIDSRVILDRNGADLLLGKGDMLYAPLSLPDPVRLQGAFADGQLIEETVEAAKGAFKSVTKSIGADPVDPEVEMRNLVVNGLIDRCLLPMGWQRLTTEHLAALLGSNSSGNHRGARG